MDCVKVEEYSSSDDDADMGAVHKQILINFVKTETELYARYYMGEIYPETSHLYYKHELPAEFVNELLKDVDGLVEESREIRNYLNYRCYAYLLHESLHNRQHRPPTEFKDFFKIEDFIEDALEDYEERETAFEEDRTDSWELHQHNLSNS